MTDEERWQSGRADPGTTCWVTDGRTVWIAESDDRAVGGWRSGDWEDLDGEVIGWLPAQDPRLPEPAETVALRHETARWRAEQATTDDRARLRAHAAELNAEMADAMEYQEMPERVPLTEGATKRPQKTMPDIPPRPDAPPGPSKVPAEDVLRRIDERSEPFYPIFEEAQRRGQRLVEEHARACWEEIKAGEMTDDRAVTLIGQAISTLTSRLLPPWRPAVPYSPGEHAPELPSGLLTPAEFKGRLEQSEPEFARQLFALGPVDDAPQDEIDAMQLPEATPEVIRARLQHLFGAAEAEAWLSRPNRILGGKTPNELLATDQGRLEVYRAILRIEHGVFA